MPARKRRHQRASSTSGRGAKSGKLRLARARARRPSFKFEGVKNRSAPSSPLLAIAPINLVVSHNPVAVSLVRRGSFAASISRKGLCVAGPSSQRRVACNRAHGNAAYGRTGSQRLLPTRALTSASLSRPTCDRERRSRRSTAWRAQPLNRPRLRIAPLLGSVAATRAAYYRAQASKICCPGVTLGGSRRANRLFQLFS